ncbi:MAG: winged helix-turn-helix transcriptional regulator [Syntrophales bacterium]
MGRRLTNKDKPSPISPGPEADRYPIATSKTRDRLLELITENNQSDRGELSEQLGIRINGVKQHILKLKKEGILESVGGNRTRFWKTRGK